LNLSSPSAWASVPQAKDAEDTARSLEKEPYWLFDPVPETHLRSFHTDRPGSANTPYTVDAGHIQLELELVNYSEQPTLPGKNKNLNYPNPNFRVGVTNSIEVEVTFVPYVSQSNTSGIGDLNLRLKKNLLGNDGGPFAWALMPGVKVPTNTNAIGNSRYEPYLMIPFSVTLPSKWAISFMPEIDVRKNAGNGGSHTEFNSPYTIGHHLFSRFDGYAEFVTHSSNDANAAWTNYIGTGLTARTSKNTQLDAGINFGLNSATAAYNPFAGFVYRY
jgi:hypothetical protein